MLVVSEWESMASWREHDNRQAGMALEQKLTPEPRAQDRERETGPSISFKKKKSKERKKDSNSPVTHLLQHLLILSKTILITRDQCSRL